MNKELDEKIKELDDRRAQILYTLCEEDHVFHPEILLQLVHEVRSLTKILKILRSSNDNRKE